MIIVGLILTRVYFGVCFVLLLNWISQIIFAKPKHVLKSLAFIPFWPIALFSKAGRKIVLNRVTQL